MPIRKDMTSDKVLAVLETSAFPLIWHLNEWERPLPFDFYIEYVSPTEALSVIQIIPIEDGISRDTEEYPMTPSE